LFAKLKDYFDHTSHFDDQFANFGFQW